ncbi:MAG TPA: GMC family oxidoreductase [Allosphingosinicella sp.]
MPKHYRYVLIGSGVAAVTLAKQLLQEDRATSILMLEAGPRVPRGDRRGWWDYVLTGRKPYDFCYDIPGENKTTGDGTKWGYEGARIMAYGGSTGHWGAWSLRYKPEDFELFTNTGEGADWPIDYNDLDPYYQQAEDYLSVCGDTKESWNANRANQPFPRPVFGWTEADGLMVESFKKNGIEPGNMPIARYRKCMATGTCKYCPIGSRYTAHDVLDELVEDPRHVNFVMRCLSPVTKLVADRKSHIAAAEYLDTKSGETISVTADIFVVAGGTYESPKLLMRSKSAFWPQGIGNDNDLVGRHIVSHSFLRVSGTLPANRRRWLQEFDFPTLMSRTYDAPEYQQDGKIFLFKNRALPNVDIARLMKKGQTREQIRAILSGPMTFELQAFYEEKGQYQNRLIERPGTNRFGLPLMSINYSRETKFGERTQRQLARMKPVIDDMGCGEVKTFVDDPGGHHASGTCRMGETPEHGVTDKDMKVFGTDNLYVCSNAAFPTCAAVNPTLTLAALTLRLAEHFIGNSSVRVAHETVQPTVEISA